MCECVSLFVCLRENFYGLFSLGRHACSGQSQLDMPERFLLESKMGVGERREREGQ